MELSEADKVLLEQRLRRSALDSVRRAAHPPRPAPPGSAPPAFYSSPLNLTRPGPSRGTAFFPSQGAPSVSGGATAPSALGSGLGTGSSEALVKIILDQQRQLEQVGVRPRTQPAPAFQVFGHQQPPPQAQQVATSSSLRLGAQMAQLQLGTEHSEVSVLRANQLVMQVNQLDLHRQQQLAAAEKKVVFLVMSSV